MNDYLLVPWRILEYEREQSSMPSSSQHPEFLRLPEAVAWQPLKIWLTTSGRRDWAMKLPVRWDQSISLSAGVTSIRIPCPRSSSDRGDCSVAFRDSWPDRSARGDPKWPPLTANEAPAYVPRTAWPRQHQRFLVSGSACTSPATRIAEYNVGRLPRLPLTWFDWLTRECTPEPRCCRQTTLKYRYALTFN